MAKELDYPQVTEDQVELWLANPVTHTFMQCLEFRRLDSIDSAGSRSGQLTDSSSADLTHALLHREFGKQDAYVDARDPEALLDHYVMIFHPPPPEDEESDNE